MAIARAADATSMLHSVSDVHWSSSPVARTRSMKSTNKEGPGSTRVGTPGRVSSRKERTRKKPPAAEVRSTRVAATSVYGCMSASGCSTARATEWMGHRLVRR